MKKLLVCIGLICSIVLISCANQQVEIPFSLQVNTVFQYDPVWDLFIEEPLIDKSPPEYPPQHEHHTYTYELSLGSEYTANSYSEFPLTIKIIDSSVDSITIRCSKPLWFPRTISGYSENGETTYTIKLGEPLTLVSKPSEAMVYYYFTLAN